MSRARIVAKTPGRKLRLQTDRPKLLSPVAGRQKAEVAQEAMIRQKPAVSLIEVSSTTLVFAVLIWILLTLLVIVVVLQGSRTLVLSKDKNGRLEISRHALHRVIETCCEQVRGIASARASVSRKGKLLHTELRLKIRPDAKLDAIQGYLTQEIADIYGQNLGLKDIGPVEIKVVGVEPIDSTV